ncbi:MAG: dTDP-glucose 4,6-dehydratase [Planctomycetota bacterium]
MKLLVTGGCGFIGSNFIHYILRTRRDWEILNLDALTYAGNLENLKDAQNDARYEFVKGDIADGDFVLSLFEKRGGEAPFDVVVNFAAETHVDRSIHSADEFIRTNVVGTNILLKTAMNSKTPRFVQISTDEVYGSLGSTGKFTETTHLAPNSPYSASKTAADLLVRAYFKTHGFPGIITRCSNNYGPYQFPEKLIPLFISNILEDREIPVYGDGMQVRDWIYVDDHSRAIEMVIEKGRPGEVYNVGGENELTNITLTRLLLENLGKSEKLIKYVKDRPGHDRRYAIDCSKIRKELGWEPQTRFEEGLKHTIDWYRSNQEWWQNIRTGEYLEYYQKQYGNR